MAGVVLVHGAWHGPWCWAPVVEGLQRRGISVDAVDLPLTGFVDDVARAREAVDAMGPDTVLVGHSYGGLVISEASSGARTVRRLVYVAALLAEAGEDPTTILSAYGSPIAAAVVITEDGVTVDPGAAHGLFYGDSDERTAAALTARLRPMPVELAVQQVEPGWRSIPSTYVVCTNDGAVPVGAQRRMASRADEVVEIASDHSPFIGHPNELVDVLGSHLP